MPGTVPTSHQTPPPAPNDSQPYQSKETSPTIIQQAQKTSRNKLAQKNRKQNEFKCDIPITLQFERATVYTISGFSVDADQGGWVCIEMELHISGKRGSETRLTFQRAIDF